MSGFWRVVHYVAFVAWIGGGVGVILAESVLRRLDRSLWGGVADVQAALYRWLVGPGTIVTLVSGLILTLRMYNGMSVSVGAWLGMMQLTGLLGGLVTLLGAMPAAGKLGRLEPHGDSAAAFDAARRRLASTGLLGAVLAVLALFAGAMYRIG